MLNFSPRSKEKAKKFSLILFQTFFIVLNLYAKDGFIKIPQDKTIPISVSYYIDEKGNKTCDSLHDTYFIETPPFFNPALFKGALWLDITFEDTRETDGNYYSLGFGSEYLDVAEMYVLKNGNWIFGGRTGHNLLRKDKSTPTWRLNIPIDLNNFPDEKVHHIRIRMQSSIGSPVKVKIATARDFDMNTLTLTIFHFLIIGIFLFVAIFMMYYGLMFHDTIYVYLSISTAAFLFLQLQVTGIGQNFFWGLISYIPYAPRFLYIFNALLVLFLSLTFKAILKEENVTDDSLKLIPTIHIMIIMDLIVTLLFKSNMASNIGFCVLNIICCLLFIALIGVNTFGNKALKIQLVFQIPAFIIIAIRQLFYLLRTVPDTPFYVLYTNDYFFVNYLAFAFIEFPPIYLTGKRLYIRFQGLNRTAVYSKNENLKLQKRINFYDSINHEILDLNNIIRSSIRLPYKADTQEGKKTASLIERCAVQSTDMLSTLCVINDSLGPREEPVLLKSFFSSCMDTVTFSAAIRNNTITFNSDISDDFIVYADPNILEFVLSDFISTVIEYSPKNTRLDVTAMTKEDEISFSVISQMNNSEIKSIKQVFREADLDFHGNPESSRNTFISFNLIKQAVKLYKGTFSIEPTASGYRFNVTMKFNRLSSSGNKHIIDSAIVTDETLQYSNNIENVDIPDGLLSTDGSLPSILLIEENAQNRSFFSSMLTKHCNLVMADTGIEAWNYLHSPSIQIPDYVITEYELPFLSGLELFRKCSSDESLKNIPFVFILPSSFASKRSELLIKGISACIIKPFSQQEILDILVSLKNTAQKTHNTFMSQINNVMNVAPQKASAPVKEIATTEPVASAPAALFASYNLSSREQQIAMLILDGKSDKEIASSLNISPGTVASHNKNIFKKLEVHSRVELMNKLR